MCQAVEEYAKEYAKGYVMEIAMEMIASGDSDEYIKKITKLTQEEILELRAELN